VPELICTYCGTANDLHSEYLVLCAGCGKKLKGSFPEWKKNNKSGTFRDYLNQLAAIGEQKNKQKSAEVKTQSRARIAGWATAIFLIAILISGYLYFSGSWKPGSTSVYATPGQVLNDEWSRYTGSRFGLSVELPAPPEEMEGNGTNKEEHFTYHPKKGFTVTLTGRQSAVSMDLEKVATEALNEIMNGMGISNVKYQTAPIMAGDIPGLVLFGTLEEHGTVLDFRCAVFVKSVNSWLVIVKSLNGDPVGTECAERVMESIEINYFGSPV
jgi:hypothetical protein